MTSLLNWVDNVKILWLKEEGCHFLCICKRLTTLVGLQISKYPHYNEYALYRKIYNFNRSRVNNRKKSLSACHIRILEIMKSIIEELHFFHKTFILLEIGNNASYEIVKYKFIMNNYFLLNYEATAPNFF